MFGGVKSCFVLSVALLAISCVQDKKDNFSDTEDASGLLSAAALRVAIYYVGDVKCRAHLEAKGHDEQHIEKVLLANNNSKYIEAGKNTHRLDGDKAELSSKEYIASLAKDKQANPQLGGDKFLQANGIVRTLAALKDNCRRLLLSVDSEVLPSLSSQNLYHTSGNFAADSDAADNFWPARFAADFGDFGGKITCASDQLNSLCNYAQIKDGKRYFAYLYPQQGEDSLAAEVTYTVGGKELTSTVTIEAIKLGLFAGTKLSAIKVTADCGEGYTCLLEHDFRVELECKVEGARVCNSGFAFTVERAGCNIGGCGKAELGEVKNALCTDAATVAALSQHQVSLVCNFIIDGKSESDKTLLLRTHHLGGQLCVVTKKNYITTKNSIKIPIIEEIKASACERDGETLKPHMLELSFSLDE